MRCKRIFAAALTIAASVSLLSGCQGMGGKGTIQEEGDFVPTENITFNVSSQGGGNSDIFSRTIADICTKEGIVNKTFVINNNIDGNGNIIRLETSNAADPNHTLLCLSSGDMQAMLDSDVGLDMSDFTPLAIMAEDKQLIFSKVGGSYTSFEALLKAAENGTKLNVGGTKSAEFVVFQMFVKTLGMEDAFNYMMYDSSSESITALMGDHIDFAMGSPAAAKAYVESENIVPVVAFSDKRFAAPLDTAPTMEELGYGVVEYPIWRGIVGPKNMSEKAQEYWSHAFERVSESAEWQDYLSKYLLTSQYCDLETTKETMNQTQETYLSE